PQPALPAPYSPAPATAFPAKRARSVAALRKAGFRCDTPEGAYYVIAECDHFRCDNDYDAALELIRRAGIAAVPGSSFYRPDGDRPAPGNLLRFAFCKEDATLEDAERRLLSLVQAG